jgi:hypothetical protein
VGQDTLRSDDLKTALGVQELYPRCRLLTAPARLVRKTMYSNGFLDAPPRWGNPSERAGDGAASDWGENHTFIASELWVLFDTSVDPACRGTP